MVDARVLSVLVPFVLDSIDIPRHLSAADTVLALTTVYDGATPVAADAEEGTKDQAQVETPVKNLRWALQRGRVVDLDITGGVIATDASSYDSLVNLLTKAIKSETKTRRTPIVLSRSYTSSPCLIFDPTPLQSTCCPLHLTLSHPLLR